MVPVKITYVVIFLVVTTVFFYFIKIMDNSGSARCPEHGKMKSKCMDCANEYGVYIEDYQNIKVCKIHHLPDCCDCIQFLQMG